MSKDPTSQDELEVLNELNRIYNDVHGLEAFQRETLALINRHYTPKTEQQGHPEERCRRCLRANVSWTAPSPLWNEVMRGGDINGEWQWDELICMTCFVELAEAQGIASGFRLYATRVNRELKTATPSGRVWNPETWMWEEKENPDAK